MVNSQHRTVEAEVAFGQLEVVGGSTGQSLDEMTEVVAEIAHGPTGEGYR